MGNRGQNKSEEPVHRVVIPEDFWLGETPVTQVQFDAWPGAKKRGEDHWPSGNPNHPANNLSWNDAMEFCDWLTKTHARQFPKGIIAAELPCEARWEYACRAGTTTDYHTGDGAAALREAGWYNGNSESETQALKQKARNDFGLYDMHGNVWEWCLDRWDEHAYRRRWDEITDRETYAMNEQFGGQDSNPSRVLRGGSFGFTADGCRSPLCASVFLGLASEAIACRCSATGKQSPRDGRIEGTCFMIVTRKIPTRERLSLLCNSDVTGSLTSDLRPRLMPVVASQLAGVGWIFDDGSIKQPWLRSCRTQSQRDDRR